MPLKAISSRITPRVPPRSRSPAATMARSSPKRLIPLLSHSKRAANSNSAASVVPSTSTVRGLTAKPSAFPYRITESSSSAARRSTGTIAMGRHRAQKWAVVTKGDMARKLPSGFQVTKTKLLRSEVNQRTSELLHTRHRSASKIRSTDCLHCLQRLAISGTQPAQPVGHLHKMLTLTPDLSQPAKHLLTFTVRSLKNNRIAYSSWI
jgi:hypothetical protein